MKKILILTSTPPNHKGVGDIFLENAIKDIPTNNIVRVSVIKNSVEEYPKKWSGVTSHVIKVEKTHIPVISSYKLFRFKRVHCSDVADKVIDIIKNNNIEKVWVTLSSPELILLAKALYERENVNLYSTIWDIPEYLLANNNINYFLASYIQKTFSEVLLVSKKISVIDEGMKAFLPNKLHSKIHIIRNGIDFPKPLITKVKDKNTIKIVFAGSIYAKKEWNCLVESLIATNFIINNKQVELICIGRLPRFGIKKDPRITFLGYLPNSEVLNILAECDIGYVPYWFDKSKSNVVQTSFPGKVSSYLASDLKILFHGPRNSSVVKFLKRYDVGVNCTSLSIKELIEKIRVLSSRSLSSKEFNNSKKELSVEEMQKRLNLFIDVSVER